MSDALYRALALLPGLEVIEYGGRHDLIIDPATGQYIGERTVHVSDDSPLLPNGRKVVVARPLCAASRSSAPGSRSGASRQNGTLRGKCLSARARVF
jgi:hypothetical protein